jgi:hypothetical protein
MNKEEENSHLIPVKLWALGPTMLTLCTKHGARHSNQAWNKNTNNLGRIYKAIAGPNRTQ